MEALNNRNKDVKVSEPVTACPQTHNTNARSKGIEDSQDWTLTAMASQPRIQTTITMTPSNTAYGATTWSLNIDPIALTRYHFGQLRSLYQGVRIRFKFTFEFTSNFQHVGAVLMAFVPHSAFQVALMMPTLDATSVTSSPTNFFTIPRLIQMPHQIVTFGHSGTYTLESDWLAPEDIMTAGEALDTGIQDTFSANFPTCFGFLLIRGLSPLQSVGSTPEVPVVVWTTAEIEPHLYYPSRAILDSGSVEGQDTRDYVVRTFY